MAKFRYALDTIAPLWFKLVWANPNIQISSRIIQVNLLLGFKLKVLMVEMKIKNDLIKCGRPSYLSPMSSKSSSWTFLEQVGLTISTDSGAPLVLVCTCRPQFYVGYFTEISKNLYDFCTFPALLVVLLYLYLFYVGSSILDPPWFKSWTAVNKSTIEDFKLIYEHNNLLEISNGCMH